MLPQDEVLAHELEWLREFTPATRRAGALCSSGCRGYENSRTSGRHHGIITSTVTRARAVHRAAARNLA